MFRKCGTQVCLLQCHSMLQTFSPLFAFIGRHFSMFANGGAAFAHLLPLCFLCIHKLCCRMFTRIYMLA